MAQSTRKTGGKVTKTPKKTATARAIQKTRPDDARSAGGKSGTKSAALNPDIIKTRPDDPRSID